LNLNITKIKKKLDNFEKFQITRQFSVYIQNLSNQLKQNLINSKLYIIKISKKKKLSFKTLLKRNFYIDINKNKTFSLKINKVKYKLRKKNDTGRNIVKFRSNLTKIKIKPSIEKIFRNYLSSKYNKRINSFKNPEKKIYCSKHPILTLTNQQHLSFLKKESNFSHFKTYNKKLQLKIQKEFSHHHKNIGKIIFTSLGKEGKYEKQNFNDSIQLLTPTNLNKLNLDYPLKSPFKIIKKIGFIFFRNDIKSLTDSLVSTNLHTDLKKINVNFQKRGINEPSKQLINFEHSKKQYLTKTSKKQSLVKHLEKVKNLQKKRRQKKQARLTGRRKKRKRFFPRPIWLRFLLYKKFIKFRHISNLTLIKMKLDTKKVTINSKLIKILKFIVNKNEFVHTFQLVKTNTGKSKQSLDKSNLRNEVTKLNTKFLRQNIYRSNKQNWGNIFFDIPHLEKINLKKLFLL
jgi:hypothetical protein